jgi:hypothetical protein
VSIAGRLCGELENRRSPYQADLFPLVSRRLDEEDALVAEVGVETCRRLKQTQLIDSKNCTIVPFFAFDGFIVQNRVQSLLSTSLCDEIELAAWSVDGL